MVLVEANLPKKNKMSPQTNTFVYNLLSIPSQNYKDLGGIPVQFLILAMKKEVQRDEVTIQMNTRHMP